MKQKGFFGIETTAVVALLVWAGVVGTHVVSGEKAPEAPVYHNYNGGFSK